MTTLGPSKHTTVSILNQDEPEHIEDQCKILYRYLNSLNGAEKPNINFKRLFAKQNTSQELLWLSLMTQLDIEGQVSSYQMKRLALMSGSGVAYARFSLLKQLSGQSTSLKEKLESDLKSTTKEVPSKELILHACIAFRDPKFNINGILQLFQSTSAHQQVGLECIKFLAPLLSSKKSAHIAGALLDVIAAAPNNLVLKTIIYQSLNLLLYKLDQETINRWTFNALINPYLANWESWSNYLNTVAPLFQYHSEETCNLLIRDFQSKNFSNTEKKSTQLAILSGQIIKAPKIALQRTQQICTNAFTCISELLEVKNLSIRYQILETYFPNLSILHSNAEVELSKLFKLGCFKNRSGHESVSIASFKGQFIAGNIEIIELRLERYLSSFRLLQWGSRTLSEVSKLSVSIAKTIEILRALRWPLIKIHRQELFETICNTLEIFAIRKSNLNFNPLIDEFFYYLPYQKDVNLNFMLHFIRSRHLTIKAHAIENIDQIWHLLPENHRSEVFVHLRLNFEHCNPQIRDAVSKAYEHIIPHMRPEEIEKQYQKAFPEQRLKAVPAAQTPSVALVTQFAQLTTQIVPTLQCPETPTTTLRKSK